jgi:hypothetical protein
MLGHVNEDLVWVVLVCGSHGDGNNCRLSVLMDRCSCCCCCLLGSGWWGVFCARTRNSAGKSWREGVTLCGQADDVVRMKG